MKRHLPFLIIILFVILAYSNSLNGTWAMDDVVANKPVGIHDLQDLLGFRKVTSATFLLNQAVAPFSAASFRLFNIALHLLNSALLYILCLVTLTLWNRKTGGAGEKRNPGEPAHSFFTDRVHYGALLGSAIFALHPVNINAVAYIVQRMASLAAFFVLLSLLSYISGSLSRTRPRALLFYALSGGCVVLGIFSKENAVMAIPLIFLYDSLFLSAFARQRILKMFLLLMSGGLFSFGFASYFLKLHEKIFEIGGFFLRPGHLLPQEDWMAIDVSWTSLEHVLTAFRVVSRYLFLILLPLPRFLVFDWWGYPVSRGITEPVTTLLSMIFVLALLVFSLMKARQYPFICFGILWYFISISLESFLAVGIDLYYEHRNYLPLTGLIMGLVGQGVVSFNIRFSGRKALAVLFLLCTVLGTLTYTRNSVWKDSLTLWGDTLTKAPSNLRAIMAMGNAYLKISDMDKAETYYREAVRISSSDRRLYYLNESSYSLGMLYLMKRDLQQAKEVIDRLSNRIASYKPRILVGFYKVLSHDADGGLREYRSILNETRGIDRVVVLTLMGDANRDKKMWRRAVEHYLKAVSLDPGFASAYYGLGASYLGIRQMSKAEEYMGKTLSLDPTHSLALSDMADIILMKKSKPEEALAYARRAVAQAPPYYQPYLAMGNALVVLEREKEADGFYREALEKGMPEYLVPFSKARSYFMRGEGEKAQAYLSELMKYEDVPEEIKNIIHMNK